MLRMLSSQAHVDSQKLRNGFLTREEMGLPPEPPRVFDVTTEEVIQILQDPNIPDEQKREWVEFLRYRTNRPAPARRPRKAS